MIEITTFRLVEGSDVADFLDADRLVQTELAPFRPGFLRRTTACSEGGEWAVIVLWRAASDADASEQAAQEHPATKDFHAYVDATSLTVRRYETLD